MALATQQDRPRTAAARAANGSGGRPHPDEAPNIGARLRQAFQAYNAAFSGTGADGRRQQTAYELMEAVDRHQPCSQTVLATATGIDRSTTATTITRLYRKGFLKRKRTKDDERAYAVELTAEGRKALAALRKRAEAVDATAGKDILRSLRPA